MVERARGENVLIGEIEKPENVFIDVEYEEDGTPVEVIKEWVKVDKEQEELKELIKAEEESKSPEVANLALPEEAIRAELEKGDKAE